MDEKREELKPGEGRVVAGAHGRLVYQQRGGGDPLAMYRARMAAMGPLLGQGQPEVEESSTSKK